MPADPLPAELTLVVPCCNEAANVAPMVGPLAEALRGIAREVVLIDDDSPDGPVAAVRAIRTLDPRVRGRHRIWRRALASAVIANVLLNNRISSRAMRLRGARPVHGSGAVAKGGLAGLLVRENLAGWCLAGGAGALLTGVWRDVVSATPVGRSR